MTVQVYGYLPYWLESILHPALINAFSFFMTKCILMKWENMFFSGYLCKLHHVLMHFQFLCEVTAMSALAYGSLVWPPSKFHCLHPGVGKCAGCYIGVCVW